MIKYISSRDHQEFDMF